MPPCVLCNNPLRKFSVKKDWQTRKLHKKCWKEIKKMQNTCECLRCHPEEEHLSELLPLDEMSITELKENDLIMCLIPENIRNELEI